MTIAMASPDLEAILSVANTEVEAVAHAVADHADALFTWDYERSRPALSKLYEKGKRSQWNGQTDLPWELDVDQEKMALEEAALMGGFGAGADFSGTSFAGWGD